jgi:hypothetical protein
VDSRFVKFAELLIGRWEPPIAVAFAKFGLGIVVPVAVLIYGLSGILTRQSRVLARGGLSEVSGLPAIAVGIAYVALGLTIYIHICWEDHPYLAPFRDLGRQLLLVVLAVALVATFGLALI